MPNKYQPILNKFEFKPPRPQDSEPFLTEDDLQRIEAKLGHRLPKDYREFLRNYPGITSNNAAIPINFEGHIENLRLYGFCGSTQQNDLADFYFFVKGNLEGDDENCNLEWYPGLVLLRDIAKYPEAIGWPEELFPIAVDWAANLICIALGGLRPGAIFFWKSLPMEGRQNLYLVADSFDRFMNMLQMRDE
ncbi:hypothetical protein EON83_03900 [bacterium]|nr:MAG: hypothetical protein EON83_03900 [bacterium]